MDNVNLLRKTLKPHLKWHGARLSFLALFLIALFRVKTVNLVDLSIGFKSKAKKESNYKRLQRFLREFDLDYVAPNTEPIVPAITTKTKFIFP